MDITRFFIEELETDKFAKIMIGNQVYQKEFGLFAETDDGTIFYIISVHKKSIIAENTTGKSNMQIGGPIDNDTFRAMGFNPNWFDNVKIGP